MDACTVMKREKRHNASGISNEGMQFLAMVIPKGNRTGKWRLIVDLSSPESGSVNEGISQQLCTLTYVSVDDIAAKILELGRGTMLAKLDIQSAYRL